MKPLAASMRPDFYSGQVPAQSSRTARITPRKRPGGLGSRCLIALAGRVGPGAVRAARSVRYTVRFPTHGGPPALQISRPSGSNNKMRPGSASTSPTGLRNAGSKTKVPALRPVASTRVKLCARISFATGGRFWAVTVGGAMYRVARPPRNPAMIGSVPLRNQRHRSTGASVTIVG